ncbi:MAG TPA: ATP-binding protein [Micromonosporaceae bacterium]|nr:ATP-binding protein [Micromonosporaceae bacterium]
MSATEPVRLSPAELKTLFLFESLDDGQLRWLADHGDVRAFPAGTVVLEEGEPAEYLTLLLSGTIAWSRKVQDHEVETSRTDQRGVYAGAMQAYIRGPQAQHQYTGTLRAISDIELLFLPADDFGSEMRRWFPMAIHLLEGLFFGMRNTQTIIGQREHLLALGSLSAGLMHELNNPAAATARAASALRERVAGMRHKLTLLAEGEINPVHLRHLLALQEAILEKAAKAPKLTALEVADREDEVGDWLDAHQVTDGWNIAPIFVAGGVDTGCLDDIAGTIEPDLLDQSLRWLAYTLETDQLTSDIEEASARITSLVGAVKQYSQIDRATHQWIDVHDGLDSTMVMLAHKVPAGITVVKAYDRTLPAIPAHPAELNQVWTNLIDNAVQAMGESGTLTLRTASDHEGILVEIGDTGPGVPEALQRRVFEPFFTTKPVGQGTGLGLDISYRIVVNRHGGDLSLTSVPGDTRFQIRLPLREPASN